MLLTLTVEDHSAALRDEPIGQLSIPYTPALLACVFLSLLSLLFCSVGLAWFGLGGGVLAWFGLGGGV
eukprot:2651702-Rhodomonas_salina.1